MDQLASIGVGFLDGCIDQIFQDNVLFYHNLPKRTHLMKKQWAKKSTYEQNKPVRPFGLGKICETYKGMHHFAGKAVRTPGLYHRASLVNSAPTIFKLVQTNERIHSSVRIRMQLSGLGPNDHGLYKCPALTKPRVWHLRQMESYNDNPIPSNASWGPEGVPGISDNYLRWVWFYTGPEKTAPQARVLIEDNLGPYQRSVFPLDINNLPSNLHYEDSSLCLANSKRVYYRRNTKYSKEKRQVKAITLEGVVLQTYIFS